MPSTLKTRARQLVRLTCAAALLLGCWHGTAHADARDDARRRFLDGLDAAQRGEYREALNAFLSAQELHPHPATMYNIAHAYEDLGDLRKAQHWYRLYSSESPNRANEVWGVLRELEARMAPAPRTETPAPPPKDPASGG